MSDSLLIPDHDMKRANVLVTLAPEKVLGDSHLFDELGVWDGCFKGSPQAHIMIKIINMLPGLTDDRGEPEYDLANIPLGIEQTRALRDTLTAWLDEQVSE